MLIDLSPLRKHRPYRYLYFGQFVSGFGSMITVVALPYQVYELTKSTLYVGLIGLVELVPMLLAAFIGGALADSVNRRKLLLASDATLFILACLLVWNAQRGTPSLPLIFICAAVMAAVNGFHRPAHESLTPRLVSREDIPAVALLASLRSNIAMIAGPAVAGVLISQLGIAFTFGFDAISYAIAFLMATLMGPVETVANASPPSLKSIREGFRYALSRQELVGTYVVDFVAMVFGMPMALFPALAEAHGGAKVVGLFYSAPAVGALFTTLTGRWMAKIDHHGRGVILSAGTWGVAIVAFGISHAYSLSLSLFFLALAGAADMASGVFRTTIWNQTIPDRLRGRLAGIEMISYMSGPLLGNAQVGTLASVIGPRLTSIVGGNLCIVGVVGCAFLLPKFWKYDRRVFSAQLENHH